MPDRDDSVLRPRALADRDARGVMRDNGLATVTPLRRRSVAVAATPTAAAPVRRTTTVNHRELGARATLVSNPTRPRPDRIRTPSSAAPSATAPLQESRRLSAGEPPLLTRIGAWMTSRSRTTPPPAHPKRRLIAVFVAMLIILCGFSVRLLDLQVLNRESYANRGTKQRQAAVAVAADRGSIFDRNGNDLALSVPAKTIYADPRMIKDPVNASELLAPILGMDVAAIREKLDQRTKSFVYIARKVEPDVAEQVRALRIAGIDFVAESKRYYPGGSLAASVLGFVGTDNNGLSGLETAYDSMLTGTPGQLVFERDPQGREIPFSKRSEVDAQRGQDLQLTLDQTIQYEAERVLTEEVAATNAKGGTALIADVKTGDVLAMVTINGANEEHPARPAANGDRNRTVTDVYEPGSTNKVITLAAALEEGLVSPTTSFQVPMIMKVGDATFEDHDQHGMMDWTTTDILRESSNVGTIMIGRQVGKDRLDSYLRRFGFGRKTSLDLPGESSGILLAPEKYSSTSMATVPIGNGLAVTPAQMLSVYMTIANGGVSSPLRLVSATIDTHGAAHAISTESETRIVSDTTAANLRAMLTEVVDNGTGTLAAIPGYSVAGKTGTARKPPYDRPPYRYMASFAGFAPVNNPRLAAIVVLDEPQTEVFGGRVAAPAFSRMMAYALRAMKIAPDAASQPASVANTAGGTAATATKPPAPLGPTRTPGATGTRNPPTSLAPTPRASVPPAPNG
ncbi:MAG: peptidoglycan D,D-transpeptidase FtsI family protein [Acidimicrobiia bacterium]